MASRWILNKKISGSIVSASRHAIRGALLPRFDRLTLHTINRSKYEKENTPVFLINTFLNHKNKTKTGNTSYCRHSSDGFHPCWCFVRLQCRWKTNLPLFMDRLAGSSLLGVMVWEEWMNVAICVGDTEMLDKAPSGFAEPSHPCGQYAAAPLTLIHINSTQSSRSGQARLVSLPVCAAWNKNGTWFKCGLSRRPATYLNML